MSKTSQRMRSAYNDGFRLGRYQKDSGWLWRFQYAQAFARGYEDGKIASIADSHKDEMAIWHNRVLAWLVYLCGATESHCDPHKPKLQ